MNEKDFNIIGDNQRKSRFDPNLAEQVNREVEEQERKKALEEKLGKRKPETIEEKPEMSANAPDMKGFIYVPSIGIYVAKQRSLYNRNWNDTHVELNKQGLFMPTIYQFKEYIRYLKDDKNGYKDRKEAESILDDILTFRKPWRGEWLDASFKNEDGGLYINLQHRFDTRKEMRWLCGELENCLMKDKQINLDDWLKNANSQGLPKQDVKRGSLHYCAPADKRVAGFFADPFEAILVCNWTCDLVSSVRGVFACYEDKSKKDAPEIKKASSVNDHDIEIGGLGGIHSNI